MRAILIGQRAILIGQRLRGAIDKIQHSFALKTRGEGIKRNNNKMPYFVVVFLKKNISERINVETHQPFMEC